MQADTSTEVLVVTDLEDTQCCEHPHHATRPKWHEDGDEHYIKPRSVCGHMDSDTVFIVCHKWMVCDADLKCDYCDVLTPMAWGYIDLGPVKDYHP